MPLCYSPAIEYVLGSGGEAAVDTGARSGGPALLFAGSLRLQRRKEIRDALEASGVRVLVRRGLCARVCMCACVRVCA